MTPLVAWLAVALATTAVLWLVLVGALLLAGRRVHARALAGFVPDCVVLVRRLRAAGALSRGGNVLLLGLLAYLALPFDLIPDVLPLVGQLDDALLVAVVLRLVVGAAGEETIRAAWPGPEPGLRVVLRLARA